MKNNQTNLSIIIPAYNEEKTLAELSSRLHAVLAGTNKDYEIIFINDGSTDKSLDILKKLRDADNRIKIIDFSRNLGQQVALTAGIDYSKGKAVILMDADLQDGPELIIEMLKEWEIGNEVVYAIRKKRKENFVKKLCYKSFYLILSKLANIHIPADSGDFSLLDRKVVDAIKNMPEKNVFVRGMRSWVGFKQVGIEYERNKRYADKSKYTFSKLLKLAADGIFSFSTKPLRMTTLLGLFLFTACLIQVLYKLYINVFSTDRAIEIISTKNLILIIGSLQIIIFGLIGEYIGRIYEEVKQRPRYIIRDLYGLD